MLAARNGHKEALEVLIGAGGDVNAADAVRRDGEGVAECARGGKSEVGEDGNHVGVVDGVVVERRGGRCGGGATVCRCR